MMWCIDEVVYLIRRSLDACCFCVRKEIVHDRLSSYSRNSPDVSTGTVNPALILDQDVPVDFTVGGDHDIHSSDWKPHIKLKLQHSHTEADNTENSVDSFVSRADHQETHSTRESGYGRSIEDSVTSNSAAEQIITISASKSKVIFRIAIQDETKSWFVYRRPLEFVYLQQHLRKHIGPIGPKLCLDETIRVQDLDDFLQQIVSDRETAQIASVRNFLNLDRYIRRISTSTTTTSTDNSVLPVSTVNNKSELILDPTSFITSTAPQSTRKSVSKQTSDSEWNPNCISIGNVPLGCEEKIMSPSDFEFLSVIGKGSFGKVMMARRIDDNKIYAVKMLSKRMIMRRNETAHVLSERSVLTRVLSHPYIVQLHFAFTTSSKIFFVLDFVNGGELFYHLQRERTFTESRAKFYAAEICCALTYIHEKGIVYRDLKPENILLDKEGHIVLTDFGLCKEGLEHASSRTATFCGTPEYLAPEIILKMPYTRSVDWWTFGAVLHEMLYGLPPFYAKNTSAMYNAILKKTLKLKRSASPIARDLISQLLQKTPSKRLGAGPNDGQDIKDHCFFELVDWDYIECRKVPPPFIPRVSGDDDLRNIDPAFTREPVTSQSSTPTGRSPSAFDSDVFQGFTYVNRQTECACGTR